MRKKKKTFEKKFRANIAYTQFVILLTWHYYICSKILLGFIKQKFNEKYEPVLICTVRLYLAEFWIVATEYLALH